MMSEEQMLKSKVATESKLHRYELRSGYWGKYDPRRFFDKFRGVESFKCYDRKTGKKAPFSYFFLPHEPY